MFRWLYPITCEFCGEPSDWAVCPACLEELPRLQAPICLYCGEPVAGEQQDPHVCDACRDKPRTFSFARSALQRSPVTMDLLYRLKYHHDQYLAPALALAMAELWETTPELDKHDDWALVPIPVTFKRLFNLGYNHAESLAKALGGYCNLPVVKALVRKVAAKRSQTRLSAEERYKNSLDAYAVAPAFANGRKPLPPHLLLVDDVYTTGSTARACAQLLKSLPGVEEVGMLSLIRAM